MQFKPNFKSYIILGFFFLVFVGIPAGILMTLASAPFLVGGALSGNLAILLISMLAIMVIGLGIMGWLIFRFVKGNKFG